MLKIYRKVILIVNFLMLVHFANAQVIDSNQVFLTDTTIEKKSNLKKVIVPASLLLYGASSLQLGRLRQLDRYVKGSTLGDYSYSGSVDDYLRYGPAVAVYGLNLVGIRGRSNFVDRTLMLTMAISLTSTLVTLTKRGVDRERPDGSSFTSFPSSHTAMAFMSAEFMHQEYRELSPWFTVIGYAMATTTGVLRLYHHVHWLSDVVMGAGYGILSTKLVYIVYPYLKKIILPKLKSQAILLPVIQKEYTGISFDYKFR